MNRKTYIKIAFAALLISLGIIAGYTASATSKDDIVYPVAELGGCENQLECRTYCDDLDNINECLDFAQVHNLLSDEEIAHARQFENLDTRPGDCRSQQDCELYCEDIQNIDECLAFAEEHDLIDENELAEARLVAQALREGAQLPGNCRSKNECEAYCENTTHIRECLNFAERAGFLPPHELEEIRRIANALEAGVQLPGDCRGKDECEAYCEKPEHIEECLDFAEAAGFISPEELEEARLFAPLMARGEMPGGCTSREECENYCSQEENIEECIEVFVRVGVISPEEVELFRKTGGRGPGGCVGREECESFCNDPANQQACFDFAREHGLISEDELHDIAGGLVQFHEGFESAPPEVRDCLNETIGIEVLEKIDSGIFLPDRELGEKMRTCFEEFFSQQGFPSGEFEPGHEGEFGTPRGGDFGRTSEQQVCLERILGDGFPTPELERQIREECFAVEDFFPEGFEPEHDGGFERLVPEDFEPHDGGFPTSDTETFGVPSDFNAQICMERMIASLTGPPPPDFDQLIREKCFGELIERRVQQQIQEQTFQETRDAETGEVVPIEEPIRESDASTFTEPILEPVETVPPPPAEETRDTEETTSTEQPTPVSDFAGAVVNGGKIFIDAVRSLLGL